jgi:hypothetical protein
LAFERPFSAPEVVPDDTIYRRWAIIGRSRLLSTVFSVSCGSATAAERQFGQFSMGLEQFLYDVYPGPVLASLPPLPSAIERRTRLRNYLKTAL